LIMRGRARRVTSNNNSNERLIVGERLTPTWRPFACLRPAAMASS